MHAIKIFVFFFFCLAEVTGSNVVSVAEHVVMQILALVRNFIPAYKVGYDDIYKYKRMH
jgi:lactate dehydrogenase-like 2-hydroxyacid dehydrogenase